MKLIFGNLVSPSCPSAHRALQDAICFARHSVLGMEERFGAGGAGGSPWKHANFLGLLPCTDSVQCAGQYTVFHVPRYFLFLGMPLCCPLSSLLDSYKH